MTDVAAQVVLSSRDRHYFGCRLLHVLSLDLAGAQPAGYLADHQRRSVELLNCLMNLGDERVVYDLRLISRPEPNLYTRGRVSVVLLCRMEGVTQEEAGAYAGQLHRLLDALFPEYLFELVPADEIPGLLRPFQVGHAVTLRRRAGWERLDTLATGARRPRVLGFLGVEGTPQPPEPGVDALFHIFPFVPKRSEFTGLLKLLLLEAEPIAVSCRLQPTSLRPEEEAFLERQIARCERAAQTHRDFAADEFGTLEPTLQRQARDYQGYQSRLLLGLKDNAALMSVDVVSPARVPVTVVDSLGGLMTEPAGGPGRSFEGHLFPYLAGGYEVCELAADSPAVRAFEELDPPCLTHPAAPREAQRLVFLFDSLEAVAAFRLPPASLESPLGLRVRTWRSQAPPGDLPDQGCRLGVSGDGRARQDVRIGRDDRRRHLYVVGQTGTGKTTLLKTMILEDMRAGEGLCVIDPHGDLFDELLGLVPENRIDDVVVFDPTDTERPVGLNFLEYQTESQRHFLAQELAGIVHRLLEDEYGTSVGQFAGPVFFQHVRMNVLLAMSNPAQPGTLVEFHQSFLSDDYWRRWLPLKTQDPLLKRWVEDVLPKTSYTKQGSEGLTLGSWIASKFEGFVFDPMLRHIFGQKRSTIDLRTIMDEGKILLVNLAKGELTEPNSRFLGMVLLGKIMAAAMSRVTIPKPQRRDFYLYVDEFQSIATQSFVTLLSEARKFGLSLVLANQFVSQIKDERIIQGIFGNVGTIICFRLGPADAEMMEREFVPAFNRHDLMNLPNWHGCISTIVRGQTLRPFSLQTVVEDRAPDEEIAVRVREKSRVKFGRPREKVEAELRASLSSPR